MSAWELVLGTDAAPLCWRRHDGMEVVRDGRRWVVRRNGVPVSRGRQMRFFYDDATARARVDRDYELGPPARRRPVTLGGCAC